MPIYPYSFQLPPLNVQDIPNDGAPGEFLGINVGGALDWLPAGGGGSGDMLAANNLSELTNFATARTNIGLGTASTPTFANLTLTSPSLSSSAPVTISQTWNQIGTAFTAFKVNATSTNSASGSLLLDLQVGGASVFKVSKTGSITANNTINLAGSIVQSSGNFIPSNALIFDYFNQDVVLQRDAPNTLALRNGAAAQTFRVYNTYTDASNYERAVIAWAGNTLSIGTEIAGSGVSRNIAITGGERIILRAGNQPLLFGAGGLTQWSVNTSGHLIAVTDNTYDIGASGANRPRNVYVGTSLFTGVGGINFDINARLRSPATDVITLYNNGLSDFGRLQFGGTTNLFPAIKRNAAGLQIRLADDSANATLEAGNIYASGNVGIGTTAPGAKLDVVGNILVNGATQVIDSGNILSVKGDAVSASKAGYIVMTSGDNLVSSYQGAIAGNVSNPGAFFGTFTNHKCFIRTNNVERVAIDTAGNVGIGTTSPTSKLDVAGAVTAAGYYTATSGGVSLVANGLWQQGTGHLTLASGAILGWSGQVNVNIDQPGDTRLQRDEAYHLALRNGTNGQKFSVYGTYPGAAWERFTITAPTSGNVLLGTYKGTGGIARGLEFQTDGVTRMTINTTGGIVIPSGGTITGGFNTISFDTPQLAISEGGFLNFNLRVQLKPISNGVLQITDFSASGFNRLQFGGGSASFPSLKRSTTAIQARLADDSAFTNIQGKLTTDTAFTATTVTPTGFITLYDSTGTAYKVPCVPA